MYQFILMSHIFATKGETEKQLQEKRKLQVSRRIFSYFFLFLNLSTHYYFLFVFANWFRWWSCKISADAMFSWNFSWSWCHLNFSRRDFSLRGTNKHPPFLSTTRMVMQAEEKCFLDSFYSFIPQEAVSQVMKIWTIFHCSKETWSGTSGWVGLENEASRQSSSLTRATLTIDQSSIWWKWLRIIKSFFLTIFIFSLVYLFLPQYIYFFLTLFIFSSLYLFLPHYIYWHIYLVLKWSCKENCSPRLSRQRLAWLAAERWSSAEDWAMSIKIEIIQKKLCFFLLSNYRPMHPYTLYMIRICSGLFNGTHKTTLYRVFFFHWASPKKN